METCAAEKVGGSGSAETASVDIDRILAAVGPIPRVAYEAPHVYPLSAPNFMRAPGTERQRLQPGPLKLYVHIPFCNYACTFCFYAKRVNVSRMRMERFVSALARELEWVESGTPLQQLYLGGGTPTALPADLLDEVLSAVFGRLRPLPQASITVECSPESLSDAHLDVMRAHHVDRVSIGVETLDERLLDIIHRRHSARQACDACMRLVDAGFSLNVDLIYGFPGQNEESLRGDLETIAALRPESFTLYNLRLNQQTPLGTAVPDAQPIDLARLMRWRASATRTLSDLGYDQTRWHMFVRRTGRASGYHRAPGVDGFGAGRVLGVGPSAVSHLGLTVYRNHDGLHAYLARVERGESPVEEIFQLAESDRRTLFVVRTLGDGRALDRAEYARTFGSAIDTDFGEVLHRLRTAGLICDQAGPLSLSDSGALVYDLVTLAFYPPAARQWLAAQQHSS